ncbi:MAG TPA: transcription termination factor NusA [Candidatus Bathyarchaeia archaeon]|nr:transcription termination factor NusA [Candidatus Bathyarchaeia archaeon]
MAIKARTEFASALNQVCLERGVEPEVVLETIKTAILAAYRKDFGLKEDLEYEVELDPNTGGARVYSWEEGKKKQKKDITPPGFGRIAAQTAKQVILQKIREAEKDAVIAEYSEKVGTLVNGMILRFDGPNVIVDIGKTEGVMPPQEQTRSERYQLNQRLTFYIEGISESTRGQEVIVSRSHEGLVESLFRREVPEVSNGAVKVRAIAREAGSRTKIAVSSSQVGVDPVGSCVGQKGVRVQAVISELNGEKIDVIGYSDDPVKFITAALSPAEGVKVEIDEKKKTAVVAMPDDQLSLAIGREGQNVRLAAKLTGYRIDIKGAKKTARKPKKASEEESELAKAGLTKRVINSLGKAKIETLEDLKKKSKKELAKIKGLGPKALKEIEKVVK